MPKTAQETVLHMAMELSNKKWRLGFQAGNRRRFVSVDARDLASLDRAISLTKHKLGLAADSRVVSCYEAGRDGFWIHRALLHLGVENIVVDSASIEVSRRKRRPKTDKIDVKKLLKQLVRHHGGEEDVWSILRIPSVEDEDGRRNHRERDRLVKERAQHSNRIKSLLSVQGVDLKNVNRWLPKTLETLRTWNGSPIPPALKEEILREHARWSLTHEQIGKIDTERKSVLQACAHEASGKRSRKLAEVNHLVALRGVGITSGWKLTHEFFWRDFNNRREVGGASGLTGTPFDSGEGDREQGISKSGNASIRALMVELSWCWLRFQPQSALSRWYMELFAKGKRFRKVGIVALARRLLIALWRYVKHGVVPAGAKLKQLPMGAA